MTVWCPDLQEITGDCGRPCVGVVCLRAQERLRTLPRVLMAPRPEADYGDEDRASSYYADLMAPFRGFDLRRA